MHQDTAILAARLSELAWKLSQLPAGIPYALLPPGLFHCGLDAEAASYIKEVKQDLVRLNQQNLPRPAFYLASKIRQKINVLVSICQESLIKKDLTALTFEKLCTRRQWLEDLEQKIVGLREQKEQLHALLVTKQGVEQLTIQQELGLLEKQLTLAEEAFTKTLRQG